MNHQYGSKRLIGACLFFCIAFLTYYMSCQKKGLVDPSQSVRENTLIISEICSDKTEVNIGGESAQISVTIIDGTRNPVQDLHVNFSSKQGSITPYDSTDEKGIAQAEYTSGTRAGFDTITVKTSSPGGKIVSDSIYIELLFTTNLTISLKENILLADGESTTDVDILLQDAAGIPVTDKMLVLRAEYGEITEVLTTDFKGRAKAHYKAINSEENIEDKIYAFFAEDLSKPSLRKSNKKAVKEFNEKRELSTSVTSGIIPYTLKKQTGERADTVSVFLKGVNLSLEANPSTAEADGKSKVKLTATLKTADDSLLSGKTINFSTDYGTLTKSSLITGENGTAQTEILCPAVPGQARITAVFGTGIRAELIFDFAAIKEAKIELLANPASIQADGNSISTITAILKSQTNNPIIDAQLQFSSTMGSLPAVAVTDNTGVTQVELKSERRNGTAAVIATYNEISDTVRVVFEGIELAVRSSPKDVIADGKTSAGIIVTLKDAAGIPLENERIILSSSSGILKYGTGYSDANGEFVDSIKSSLPGIADITVNAAGAANSTTVSFTGFIFNLEATSLGFIAGVDSTIIIATLKDTIGLPLQGIPISFSSSLGNFAEVDSVTDYAGKAYATLKSSGSGTATVTGVANINGTIITKNIQISITSAPPRNLLFQSDRSVIKINGGTAELIATVTDVSGNPVPDATVSFTIAKGPRGGEYLEPTIETTDSRGVAVTIFTSGNIGSSRINDVEVEAVVQGTGISPSRVYLTIAGEPKSLKLGYGTDPEDVGGSYYSLPMVALVSDINGNPVIDGTNVYFTRISEVGNIESPVETVDGKATTNLTYPADRASSFIEISATSKGVSDTVGFVLPGVSGVVGSVKLQLRSGSSESILGNGEQSTSIGALVKDTGNNPVGNVIVNFEIINDVGTIEASKISGAQYTTEGTTNPNWGFAYATVTAAACTTDQFPIIVATVSGFADTFYSDYEKGVVFKGIDLSVTSAKDTVRLGENTTINVHLKEKTSQVAISDVSVKFGATKGAISNLGITDSTGRLAQQFTAGNVPGTAEVHVSYGSTIEKKINVEFVEIKPAFIEFTENYSSILADGMSKDTITVRVKDSRGNSLSGETVNFTIQEGEVNESSVYTDANGEASVIITSKAHNSDITTQLTAISGTVSESLSIHYRGITLTVESDPDSITANGTSTSQITARLYETTKRNLITQGTVYFQSTKGVLLNGSDQVADGEASAVLRSSSEIGTAEVTVIYGDTLEASTEVEFVGTEPSKAEFVDLSSSILADGMSKDTITVVVKDNLNNLLSGAQVDFNLGQGTIIQSIARTDENGEASVIFRSEPDRTDISTILVATSGSVSDTIDIKYRGITFTLEASPSSIVGNERSTSTITARLLETKNKNLINQGLVYFESDTGSILTGSSQVSAGEATSTLKSCKILGSSSKSALITAIYGDTLLAQTVVEIRPSIPEFITLSSDTSFLYVRGIGGNEAARISAFVTDANGDTIADGTTVTFTTNLGVFSEGQNYQTGTTSDGTATLTLSSGTVSGDVQITAVSGSVSQSKYLLTVLPGSVDTIAVSTDTVATGLDAGLFSINVAAIVKDMYGNPVLDGSLVKFELDSTAAGEKPVSAIISTTSKFTEDGFASTILTYASTDAGKGVTIVVTSGGKATRREIVLPYAE